MGRVSAPEGGFLKKALINIINIFAKDGSYVSSAEVDVNGFYASPVPAGSYSVSAYSAPVSELVTPEVRSLTVKNGELANIKFAFKRPTATVTGRVHLFDEGSTVYAWSDAGRQAQTTTGKDGRYTLRLAAGDVWHLKAAKKIIGSTLSYKTKEVVLLKLSDGASIEQDLWFLEVAFLPADAKAEFQGGKSATVALANGMRVSVPANSIPGNFEIRVSSFVESSPALKGPVYEIGFYTPAGSPVSSIQNGVSIIQIPYVNGIKNESRLRVVFWDPDSEAWRFAPQSVVDTEEKTVTGFIKFSNYLARVGVAPPEEPRTESTPPPSDSIVVIGPPQGGGEGTTPTTETRTDVEQIPPPPTEPPPPPPPPPSGETQQGGTAPTQQPPPGSGDGSSGGTPPPSGGGGGTPPPPSDSSTPGPETPDNSSAGSSSDGSEPIDSTPPVLTDLLATIIGEKAVTITWTTDEPASTKLDCGDNITIVQPNNITTNISTFFGIEKKTYTCTIISTDAKGNSTSATVTFVGGGVLGTEVQAGAAATAAVNTALAAAQSITTDLFLGSQGTSVQVLQIVLNVAGYKIAATGPGSPGNESVYFGPATQKAVIAFQSAKGLPATGYVGTLTRAALKALSSESVSTPAPGTVTPPSAGVKVHITSSLALGSQGSEVVTLQTILQEKGFLVLPAGVSPGFFGNVTRGAVILYQASKGISPTGFVGPITRAALNVE
jgi:peptidoglycan hydrolase-like protein with peptidoglycan-binding domain